MKFTKWMRAKLLEEKKADEEAKKAGFKYVVTYFGNKRKYYMLKPKGRYLKGAVLVCNLVID